MTETLTHIADVPLLLQTVDHASFRHPRDKAVTSVGVSAGTAAILGLQQMRQADAPTTAYLMVGDRCVYNCTFCAQARSSTARASFLSRVAWPLHPVDQVLPAVTRAFEQHKIMRCCLQVTASPGYWPQTLALVQRLHSLSTVPICASIIPRNLADVHTLFDCGVERVSIALDGVCERVYREVKGSLWQHQLDLLCAAARLHTGRVGTHLIIGLGETEQETATMLQKMVDWQVTVGLFAFTPVLGTAWGTRRPPSLSSYRRIQAALYLLRSAVCRVEDWIFSSTGQILSYGLSPQRTRELLADGRAFQTAGCPHCNRPYYNERPGKVMYNYPRPLHPQEIEAAISLVMGGE